MRLSERFSCRPPAFHQIGGLAAHHELDQMCRLPNQRSLAATPACCARPSGRGLAAEQGRVGELEGFVECIVEQVDRRIEVADGRRLRGEASGF